MIGERLTLQVNGHQRTLDLDPMTSLRPVLGEVLGLRSVREPCGVGACGACTVLVDGRPVKSCLAAVGLVGDARITTSEGLPPDDPVIAAFVARGAFQCGFCIAGFVMAVHGLMATAGDRSAAGQASDRPIPPDDVRSALAGNLCRCGSYGPIVEAACDILEDGRNCAAEPRSTARGAAR